MTTQATTVRASKQGVRGLIGTSAVTLALLGGVALWHARPSGTATAPQAATVAATTTDARPPIGGLAEQYREAQDARAARATAPVTTLGGIAEFHAERAAEVRATSNRQSRMGGLAELYHEQAQAARDGR